MQPVVMLVIAGVAMFSVIGGVSLLSHYYTLNGIKSRTVGDGQHGTARIQRETYTATMQALQKNTMATIRQSSISVIRPEAMVTICSIWSTNTWMSILQTIRT